MKKFISAFFAVITCILSLTYLVSCLTPVISPVYFWPMAFLALGFPYLAAAILLFVFAWLFISRKISLILFLLLFVGFRNLYATVAIHLLPKENTERKANSLRILSWNVRNFDNPAMDVDSTMSVRRQMFNYLKRINADVVCFQEFTEHKGESFLSNTKELVDLGYKYYYKTNEMPRYYYWGSIVSGTVIFSKIPIIDSGKVMLGDSTYPEHIAYIDVLLQGKKLRIFSTHFKSINLFAQLIDPNNKVIFHGDSNMVYTKSKFEKLKVFAQDHAREAQIAKEQLNKSPYPLVYVADMNSVPTSYAYYTMANGLQDAFVSKGKGLGTTLDSLPVTLRIDFLLVDKKLSINFYHKDDLHLSDHFPQFIDVSWKD